MIAWLNLPITGHLTYRGHRAIFTPASAMPTKARTGAARRSAVSTTTYYCIEMTEPVFVAFATQKGGAGKSTLTTLVASCLHYLYGRKVLAIDCDARQHSMVEYRRKDRLVIRENPAVKRRFTKFMHGFGGSVYEIISSGPGEALATAQKAIDDGYAADFVFFDITGTVNDRDIVTLLSAMDYLFVPITPETGDLKSSLGFAHNVRECMILTGESRIKGTYLVWNKVQAKDRDSLCQLINRYAASMCIESLETILPMSVKFTKDGAETGKGAVFRSTFMPPDRKMLKNSYLPELVDEILQTITSEEYADKT